jgi:prevent-host-death family protein
MNNIITANELKTKGVSALEEITNQDSEAIITVRGKNKFVVLSIEEYNYLREYELEAAINESLKDIKAGRVFDESIDDHMKRISGV